MKQTKEPASPGPLLNSWRRKDVVAEVFVRRIFGGSRPAPQIRRVGFGCLECVAHRNLRNGFGMRTWYQYNDLKFFLTANFINQMVVRLCLDVHSGGKNVI